MNERERARQDNSGIFMERGPGLYYDYKTWVEARAPGKVLIGGLGAFGAGSMWMDEEPHHRDYPGYGDAPWNDKAPEGPFG